MSAEDRQLYDDLLTRRAVAEHDAARLKTGAAIRLVLDLDREVAAAYRRIRPPVKIGNRS